MIKLREKRIFNRYISKRKFERARFNRNTFDMQRASKKHIHNIRVETHPSHWITKILDTYIDSECDLSEKIKASNINVWNRISISYHYVINRHYYFDENNILKSKYTWDVPLFNTPNSLILYDLKRVNRKIGFDCVNSDGDQYGYMRGMIPIGYTPVWSDELNDYIPLKLFNCKRIWYELGPINLNFHWTGPSSDELMRVKNPKEYGWYQDNDRTLGSMYIYTFKSHYESQVRKYKMMKECTIDKNTKTGKFYIVKKRHRL